MLIWWSFDGRLVDFLSPMVPVKGLWQRGESDKAKEGKLLYSLMRALLPVWESLVMLGPDSGGKQWREGREREMRQKSGRQENWQGCPCRRRKCQPRPLFSWSDTGWWIAGFRRHDRWRLKRIAYHLPLLFFWDVIDCKSLENTDQTISHLSALIPFWNLFFYTIFLCAALSIGICEQF